MSSPSPDTSEDPQVAKCQSACLEAQKAANKCEQLMEQILKAFNDWKSQVNNPNSYNNNNGGPSRGRGRGGRQNGRGRGGSGQNGGGRGQPGAENPSTPNPGNNQDYGQNN